MYSAFAGIVKRTVGAPPFEVEVDWIPMNSEGFSRFTGRDPGRFHYSNM
jgi:hypothetical protein